MSASAASSPPAAASLPTADEVYELSDVFQAVFLEYARTAESSPETYVVHVDQDMIDSLDPSEPRDEKMLGHLTRLDHSKIEARNEADAVLTIANALRVLDVADLYDPLAVLVEDHISETLFNTLEEILYEGELKQTPAAIEKCVAELAPHKEELFEALRNDCMGSSTWIVHLHPVRQLTTIPSPLAARPAVKSAAKQN